MFVGIIDVPGHERFVRQMVAGAGGIDLAMLLVAADEGVMPQTEEHVEVLRSLGVRHGLVVISKADLATPDNARARARRNRRAGARDVSRARAGGAGVGANRRGARRAARELAHSRAPWTRAMSTGPFRLAVDRVFHQKGIGVVVTGSCYSGRVRVGDELELFPAHRRVRVREIQSFGAKRDGRYSPASDSRSRCTA